MIELSYQNISLCNKSLPDDYVVLDLETTGLSGNKDRIIEISLLKYKMNQFHSRFVTLINPEITIPPGIVKLTGIQNEMVQNMPTIQKILPDVLTFIDSLTLVGHNVSFDLRFLKFAFQSMTTHQACITYSYIDTLSLSRRLIHNIKNHRLETLKNYLQIEEISHRAEQDCLVTHEVYQYCKKNWGISL